jgi:methionyl-tRNA formyltransferase
MEDPLYTLPFIKEIIKERQNDIIGLAVTKGDRFTIGKKRSKIAYLFSLLIIMGFFNFFKNSVATAYI